MDNSNEMLIRPRLNDFHGLLFTQEEVDFAIPFLDEDIPLYLDPFLLWKSPSQMDNGLYSTIVSSFNSLGSLYLKDEKKAIEILVELSECNEVGLGNSKTKQGKKIGNKLARAILAVFKDVPQIQTQGLAQFEAIQLLVEDISKDRISDIACNFIKSFLIDYTIQQADAFGIPRKLVTLKHFDVKRCEVVLGKIRLPINPTTKTPVLLIPKRWLRFVPWISFDDYFENYVSTSQKIIHGDPIGRVEILEYNRKNYDQVQSYIKRRQLQQKDCKNDPLFTQIPVLSSKRKRDVILKLPTGKTQNADIKYEDNLCPLLASMLYPELDFAQLQSRTDSGVLIRDLIFYNNASHVLLKEIFEKYDSRQIVFELKNVEKLNTNHINQINRYLNNEFGSFGVIFTRNQIPKNVFQNTINLWAGQRKCILILDDSDLKTMCEAYESKQRNPIDVINKKYREFIRACPS